MIAGGEGADAGGEEAVFGVPDEGAEGGGRYRQRIGSGVAIEVINRRDACSTLLNGGVLVQRIRGIVVCRG